MTPVFLLLHHRGLWGVLAILNFTTIAVQGECREMLASSMPSRHQQSHYQIGSANIQNKKAFCKFFGQKAAFWDSNCNHPLKKAVFASQNNKWGYKRGWGN